MSEKWTLVSLSCGRLFKPKAFIRLAVANKVNL